MGGVRNPSSRDGRATATRLIATARNAVFFMARNPLKMFIIVALDVVPLFLTYLDERMMPLYGFIWVTCGFALVALIDAKLLLNDFAKFLPKVNEWGEFVSGDEE